ncbi:hypothetical protein B0H16DRAFT_1738893 [Mycena metata]|uniref:Uncharacterized protein n=1 Tax=Mycena metata TaxID=1033252 RepID=A0AAD7MK16_9AGAR|nr:hypothetical protein B0H16DRAFT_1738893 [Mycena metata]
MVLIIHSSAARRHTPRRPKISSPCPRPKPSCHSRAEEDLRPNPIPHALPQPRRRRTDADRTETQLDLVIPTNSELPLLPRMHVLAAAYAASAISAEHPLSDAPVASRIDSFDMTRGPRHLEDAATLLACNARLPRPRYHRAPAPPPRRRSVPGTRLASVPPTPTPARFDSIHRRLDRGRIPHASPRTAPHPGRYTHARPVTTSRAHPRIPCTPTPDAGLPSRPPRAPGRPADFSTPATPLLATCKPRVTPSQLPPLSHKHAKPDSPNAQHRLPLPLLMRSQCCHQ